MSNTRIQLYPGAGEEILVFDDNIDRYDENDGRLTFVLTTGATIITTLPYFISHTSMASDECQRLQNEAKARRLQDLAL